MGHDTHAPEQVSDDGPAVIPPVPDARFISPAVADFAHPPAVSAYVWPLFWMGVGVLLAICTLAGGWHGGAH